MSFSLNLSAINFAAIGSDLAALKGVLLIGAEALGWALIAYGVLQFVKSRGSGGGSPAEGGLSILAGGCLAAITSFLVMAGSSVTGGSSMYPTAISNASGPAATWAAAVGLANTVAWLVGLAGLVTGTNGLRKRGHDAAVGTCLVRIIGGGAAMNLTLIMQALGNWGGVFASIASLWN